MCNSFDTVDNIILNLPNLDSFLIDSNKYYAHVPPQNLKDQLKPETLVDHSALVLGKLGTLVQAHDLDPIIDGLISDLTGKNGDYVTGNFIKKLFVCSIFFHDFGKVNENFQSHPDKMDNEFFVGKGQNHTTLSTHHSALGAYIYIVKKLDEIISHSSVDKSLLISCLLVFSYSIFKHHSKYLQDDFQSNVGFSVEQVECMKMYLDKFQFKIQQKLAEEFVRDQNTKKFLENCCSLGAKTFGMYALSRLNYSLLTASDYLATNQYLSGNKSEREDLGLLSESRVDSIFKFIAFSDYLKNGKPNYNKLIYNKLINKDFLTNPKVPSASNLSILRLEMGVELITNIRKNHNQNLFYIEAPTGGGKTNLSMLATVELLKANKNKLRKVFYVFPFTTLITQTYNSITETLDLNENEITQLHSKAGYKNFEDNNDGLHSNNRQNYIDNLFINYPFCLLSHIKFFDILKTNEKEVNYLLHRLANSIVVIDELQSYNPEHWDKIMYFIGVYAQSFNIKFILMSATLPKLGKLDLSKEVSHEIVYLLPNARNDYFLNPNFRQRVSFNYDLFERNDLTLDELAKLVLIKSKEFSQLEFGESKPAGSVYTIIEFIFKKSATEFYKTITTEKDCFFDEIFLLSGTILEHRRKYIINFLKSKKSRTKRILLITTQVVEAGVDIDMDLGFKDRTILDSEEQLAGRINRNVNKKECKLYLFNFNKEDLIYGRDRRFAITKKLTIEQYKCILDEKNFDLLYSEVLKEIEYWNTNELVDRKNNTGLLKNYRRNIEQLKFRTVHSDFKLIDNNNITCFIPLEVPIKVPGLIDGTFEEVFTKSEVLFLEQFNVFQLRNEKISGKEVFDVYIKIITTNDNFMSKKINSKILQGIISKFIFSIFVTPKIEKQIIRFSDLEKSSFGYQYIEHWRDFYCEISGIDDSLFFGNETQFL